MGLFKEKEALVLLVGVGQRPEYDNFKMSITSNDAMAMQKVLTEYVRIDSNDITCLVNEQATSDAILESLRTMKEKTMKDEARLVIIYFSGHGRRLNDEFYFICNDTMNGDVSTNSLSGRSFLDSLSQIRSDQMLVLLDCCHAGLLGIGEPVNIPFNTEEYLLSKPNRIIISACHKYQTALLSSPLSLFTFALTEGLTGKDFGRGDNIVTAFDLAMYVRERVSSLSATFQKPQLDVLQNSTTVNFPLVLYPNGKPPLYFPGEFNLFDENSKALDLTQKPVKDEGYRKQFIQFATNIININSINTANFDQQMCKVVIKEFKDLSASVEIDGKIHVIPNELIDLRKTLAEQGVNTFQFADKIINIQHVDEANFRMLSGKMVFNQLFTKKLVEILAEDNESVNNTLAQAKKNPNWEKDQGVKMTLREVIHKNYKGILKIFIANILAIGGEEPTDDVKIKNYIKHCGLFATRIVRFISFIQIAEFWDFKDKNKVELQNDERETLNQFFDGLFEMSPFENYKLVCKLCNLFQRVNCKFRLNGMNAPMNDINNNSLFDCFVNLQRVLDKMGQNEYGILQCAECENHICCIMESFKFLAKIKIISMQGSAYENVYKGDQFFVHRFYNLQKEGSCEKSVDQYDCTQNSSPSEGIVVFDEDYKCSVCLFPFLIDLNTIVSDSRSKIYLFNKIDTSPDTLNYSTLEDYSYTEITLKDKVSHHSELNAVIGDDEKKRQYKFNVIYSQFYLAKSVILS